MKNKDIGQQLASLNHLIKRNLQNELSSELMRISAANGYILVYLYENKQNDVFQRDLEEYFNITRSTASKVLSLMETKGLIRRGGVDGDARLKKLVITKEGEMMLEALSDSRKQMEDKLTDGFSEDELDRLHDYLRRMKEKGGMCRNDQDIIKVCKRV